MTRFEAAVQAPGPAAGPPGPGMMAESSPGSRALPAVSPAARKRLLQDLLRGVSRTFYLTIRVLPGDLQEPVGLAYLLARAADTIADTRLLPPSRRLELLLAFREQVGGPAQTAVLREIGDSLTGEQSIAEERILLESLPDAFSLLEGQEDGDARLARSVLYTLTRGMESDLVNFPPEDSGRVDALETLADLDKYLYQVAGCVGRFWTEISTSHAGALRHWDPEVMSGLGIGYGKALQLTNVLRDLPRDLRMGRCYIPREELRAVGMEPEELLEPGQHARAWPILTQGLRTALEHYSSGEQYLLAIPRRCLRLRAAALWPMLIGLATLSRLAQDARDGLWLQPDRPSRVTRKWVYRTVALSLPLLPSNRALRAWIRRLRRGVEAAIS